MRIGLVSLSCDNRSGIGRIVRALAARFAQHGHDVHCVAQSLEGVTRTVTRHLTRRLPASRALSKFAFRIQSRRVMDTLECDIVDAFGVGRGAQVVSAQSCHKAGIDILRTFPGVMKDRRSWGLFDAVSLQDERVLLTSPQTRKIIACSETVKRQIMAYYGVDPDRIVVIPNGVDESLFAAPGNRGAVRERLGISPGMKVLLFMGNEFGRKGLGTVLKSMRILRMPDLRLIVVGAGNAKDYGAMARSLGVEASVTFHGPVNGPEEYFCAADAFVLPALYEPFGMVIGEAMAAGVPVITSAACGAVENLTSGTHGIFLDDPADASALAERIAALLRDELLCARMAAAGRSAAREFSWDSIALKTLSVFEDVRGNS